MKDQSIIETHTESVSPIEGQTSHATHVALASTEIDHTTPETQEVCVDSTIARIKAAYEGYKIYTQAYNRLGNSIMAKVRGVTGCPKNKSSSILKSMEKSFLLDEEDPTERIEDLGVEGLTIVTWNTLMGYYDAIFLTRQEISKRRKEYTKECELWAGQLPAWEWVESIRGAAALGLAQIVGECGDLSNYPNPAKLWKRMCVGLCSGEGYSDKVQGKPQKNYPGLSQEETLKIGYIKRRRAVLYVIGDSLIKACGPYKQVFDDRKAYEIERAEREGKEVVPHGQAFKNSKPVEGKASNLILYRRAHRYMEKRYLKNLWVAWNQAPCGTQTPPVPAHKELVEVS